MARLTGADSVITEVCVRGLGEVEDAQRDKGPHVKLQASSSKIKYQIFSPSELQNMFLISWLPFSIRISSRIE